MPKITKRKKELKKLAKRKFLLDLLLSFFVVIVPIIAVILYALGVNIPKTVFGIYASAAYIIAGTAIITCTVLEKFGFGKAGTYYNKLSGWKQLTKKEAKANTGVFGGVMIAIGIFFAILTAVNC